MRSTRREFNRYISGEDALTTATAFVAELFSHPDGRTLLNYGGEFMRWRGNRYAAMEEEGLRQRIQTWLHDALRYVYDTPTFRRTHAPTDARVYGTRELDHDEQRCDGCLWAAMVKALAVRSTIDPTTRRITG